MNDQYPLGVIGGLYPEERRALLNCETFNGARVQLAQSWVIRCLVKRRKAGGTYSGVVKGCTMADQPCHPKPSIHPWSCVHF